MIAIDHPGNVKATIGALLIATGIIVGIGTYSDSQSPEPPAVATAWGLVWAGPGAILLGTGLFTYLASRRNTDSFAQPQPVATPIVALPPPCLPPGYGWPPPAPSPAP